MTAQLRLWCFMALCDYQSFFEWQIPRFLCLLLSEDPYQLWGHLIPYTQKYYCEFLTVLALFRQCWASKKMVPCPLQAVSSPRHSQIFRRRSAKPNNFDLGFVLLWVKLWAHCKRIRLIQETKLRWVFIVLMVQLLEVEANVVIY